MSLYSILSWELTISHPKASLKMIFRFSFGRICYIVFVEGMPSLNRHFFLGGWMSEKNKSSTSPFSNPTEVFSTIPKEGCENPMGFSASFLGTPPSIGRSRTSMNRLMASKKLIMASKWASSRLQSTMECKRDKHATCWQRTSWGVLLGYPTAVAWYLLHILYRWNFLPSIIVQRGRWRASASLLLGDYVYVYNIYIYIYR